MGNIKENIAKNITALRQAYNYTQSELGEKLNYTDKSVSKWEKGDATPPVETLDEIAKLFNVSIDYLTKEHEDEIEVKNNVKINKTSKLVITLLSVSLVWLIATIGYVYLHMFAPDFMSWKFFVYAVPLSLIVLLVFNSIWGKKKIKYVIVSCLTWSIIASVYIAFLSYNPWVIFLIGVPLQIATVLWSQLHKRN